MLLVVQPDTDDELARCYNMTALSTNGVRRCLVYRRPKVSRACNTDPKRILF